MCNCLDAQLHFLIAIVAELRRLHADCAANELIHKRSAQSFKAVILHHDRLKNLIRFSDGGSIQRRSRRYSDEKDRNITKLER